MPISYDSNLLTRLLLFTRDSLILTALAIDTKGTQKEGVHTLYDSCEA